MMLALMYGVMPIAMMVMFWKEPPVIMFMKSRTEKLLIASETAPMFTPGTGMQHSRR